MASTAYPMTRAGAARIIKRKQTEGTFTPAAVAPWVKRARSVPGAEHDSDGDGGPASQAHTVCAVFFYTLPTRRRAWSITRTVRQLHDSSYSHGQYSSVPAAVRRSGARPVSCRVSAQHAWAPRVFPRGLRGRRAPTSPQTQIAVVIERTFHLAQYFSQL
jgi:hypothetical protein